MSIKSTIYDLVAYFIPGVLFILLFIVSYYQICFFNTDAEIFIDVFSKLNFFHFSLFVVLSYLLGFIISGFGNLFVEKILKRVFKSVNNYSEYASLYEDDVIKKIEKRFFELFDLELNQTRFRFIINYVENEKPIPYATAFYFLSYSGMARSSLFLFIIFSINQIVILIIKYNPSSLILLFVYIVVAIIMCYQYLRFTKYFNQQIIQSFLLD